MEKLTSSWRKSSYSDNGGNCVEVGWRKPSYSGSGGNCVEVGNSEWRKSSYSGNGGECVEVGKDGVVLVRDTTNRNGGTLSFTADAWHAFLGTLR